MASRPAVTNQTEAPADPAGATPSPQPQPGAAAVLRLLTREQILAAEDLPWELVDVPEWGGTVRVQALSGADRDVYDTQSWAYQKAGLSPLTDFRTRRVALAITDENGAKLFTAKDVAQLARKSGTALDRVDDVVVRLSGLEDGAVDKAKAELKADPNGDSGTA